jgi:hypothetical protein
VSSPVGETIAISRAPGRAVIISALGVTQIFAWGASYYLPAVLAAPIVADTGWSLTWVVGGLSLGLLTAGLVSSWVGRAIARLGGRPVLAVSASLLAIGLLALALAHSLAAFLAAWLAISGSAWARVSMIPPLQPSDASTVKAGDRQSPR